MPKKRIKVTLPSLDRTEIRKYLIRLFLRESPGTGKGDLRSAYEYVVETFSGGGNIVLRRPASLNKGMDFTIHVEGYRFRPKGFIDMPSHDNIVSDLISKKVANPTKYKRVARLINKLYNCENITSDDYKNIHFALSGGLSVGQVLMCVKWLFIEQDITYWNWSGRNMFYTKLHSEGLCK